MDLDLGGVSFATELQIWQIVLLTGASTAIGVLGGFVGLALGSIRLPILLLVGMPMSTAAGTNILVSSLTAMIGSFRHLRAGRMDFRVLLTMGLPSIIGAFIGGFWGSAVPEFYLITLIAVLVGWQGIEFVFMARNGIGNKMSNGQDPSTFSSSSGLSTNQHTVGAITGLGIGILGGAVGLILGSIRLPVLVRVLKMDPRVVAGTNMMIGFSLGSMGWMAHASRGEVDYLVLILMGIGAMIGSQYGAKLTGRVNVNTLILVMGIVLAIIGVVMLSQAIVRVI